MAPIWILAKKELRLLLRDPRAAVLLLGMPLLFILILGLLLGEGFGQNPDKRLRVFPGWRPWKIAACSKGGRSPTKAS